MNKILKGLVGIGLAMSANASFAQLTTTDINVNGTVASGCLFLQARTIADFGTIAGATAGKTQAFVSILCSNTVPYTLAFGAANVSASNISINSFDSSFVSRRDNVALIGTGKEEAIPVYLKAVGNLNCNSTFINGDCVITKATAQVSADMTMTLTY